MEDWSHLYLETKAPAVLADAFAFNQILLFFSGSSRQLRMKVLQGSSEESMHAQMDHQALSQKETSK